MKKSFVLIILLMSVSLLFSQPIKKVKIKDVVKMIDTSSVPLVINFWASWCKPCVHELAYFEKEVGAYKNKAVKLVLVSLDFSEDYPKKIAGFAKKEGYTAPIVWLDETNADDFCPKIDKSWDGAIPATIMVNNKKHYRKFFGHQITEPGLQLALQSLVN